MDQLFCTINSWNTDESRFSKLSCNLTNQGQFLNLLFIWALKLSLIFKFVNNCLKYSWSRYFSVSAVCAPLPIGLYWQYNQGRSQSIKKSVKFHTREGWGSCSNSYKSAKKSVGRGGTPSPERRKILHISLLYYLCYVGL